MINLIEFLLYVSLSVTMLYVVISFYNSFLDEKNQKKNPYYSYGIYLIFKVLLFTSERTPITNIIISIAICFMLANLYKDSILKKILATLCQFCVAMIVEVIVGFCYSTLYGANRGLEIDHGTFIFLNAIIILILMALVKIYQQVKSAKNNIGDLKKGTLFGLILIPLFSVVVLDIFYSNLLEYQLESPEFIITAILLLCINISFVALYEKTLKASEIELNNSLLKQQMEYYVQQYEVEKRNFEQISKIKHDLKHNLLFVEERLNSGRKEDRAELKEMITNMLEVTIQTEAKFFSKNHALNTILNYKCAMATKQDITIKANIKVCTQVYENERILYVILGNLIDNAVESFDSSASDLKEIELIIYEERMNLFIVIRNPYKKEIRKKDRSYITSKKDKINHGIGINSVTSLVEGNNGHIIIDTENNVFMVKVVLFSYVKST